MNKYDECSITVEEIRDNEYVNDCQLYDVDTFICLALNVKENQLKRVEFRFGFFFATGLYNIQLRQMNTVYHYQLWLQLNMPRINAYES